MSKDEFESRFLELKEEYSSKTENDLKDIDDIDYYTERVIEINNEFNLEVVCLVEEYLGN